MKKLIMECVGTFFFILTIALTGNPFAIAAMLMAWVYIGGYISGGHYNPMVSLALALRGKLSWQQFPLYTLAQIAGGFAAFAATTFLRGDIALVQPGVGITLLQAFVMEIMLAFVLASVVLAVATSEKFKNTQIFGFAIGFTIPALAAVGGPISGGLFNPAIAIGSTAWGMLNGAPAIWSNLAMYVCGAFIGGALAAYMFHYFFKE